jgi:hypothetical protein
MKIISERRSAGQSNIFLSAIVEYNGQLFKISTTQLFIWSRFNGWLFIDYGDRKDTDTTQEYIDQFIHIMEAYTAI